MPFPVDFYGRRQLLRDADRQGRRGRPRVRDGRHALRARAVRLLGLQGARGGPAGRQLGQGRQRGAGEVSLGGPQGLTIFDAGFPKAQTIDCQSGVEVNEVTDTVTAGGSTLTYDAITDTYHYVWKTDKAWAGTCRRLALGLNDSSSHSADFHLR
jgi:hypothetical protein